MPPLSHHIGLDLPPPQKPMASTCDHHHSSAPHDPAACSSKASSFCSFDVRIWEELHLKSLSSISSTSAVELLKEGESEPWSSSSDERRESKACSNLCSPHRLSNGSSSTSLGYHQTKPFFKSGEPLPIVKVIQTGSMSFTSEELVLQTTQAGGFFNQESLEEEEAGQAPLTEVDDRPVSKQHREEGQVLTREGENDRLVIKQHGQQRSIEDEEKYDLLRPVTKQHRPIHTQERSIQEEEQHALLGISSKSRLLHHPTTSDVYSAPIDSLRSCGNVPFKWEEAPGKPKQCTDLALIKPNPALKLPPRLLARAELVSNCASPLPKQRPSHHQWMGCASPRSSLDDTAAARPRNLWQSFIQSGRRSYREQGTKARWCNNGGQHELPWSPTSTLLGPDGTKALSSSSSSTSSTQDALCSSPGLSEVQSSQSVEGDGNPSHSGALICSSEESVSLLRCPIPDLGPSSTEKKKKTAYHLRRARHSLKEFFHSCKNWTPNGPQKKRNHKETEMWEPTLATYFHSMELERSSNAISNGRHQEGQTQQCFLLGEGRKQLNERPSEYFSALIDGSKCNEVDQSVISSNFSSQKRPIIAKKKKQQNVRTRRVKRARGWVLRKLRRSSRALLAIWRAVGRRAIGHKVSKRQKLPYQHIIY